MDNNVQFTEEPVFTRPNFEAQNMPKIAAWLIKRGLAKDLASANRLQILAAVVFFGLAIYLAFF